MGLDLSSIRYSVWGKLLCLGLLVINFLDTPHELPGGFRSSIFSLREAQGFISVGHKRILILAVGDTQMNSMPFLPIKFLHCLPPRGFWLKHTYTHTHLKLFLFYLIPDIAYKEQSALCLFQKKSVFTASDTQYLEYNLKITTPETYNVVLTSIKKIIRHLKKQGD